MSDSSKGDNDLIGSGRRAGVTTLQWALIGLAVLLLLGTMFLFSRMALGGTREYGMMFFPYFPLGFGFFGGFWIILILTLPFLILWPASGRQHREDLQQDNALQILRERYAKGEITKEQFDQMTRDLTHKSQ
jgi:putative membrane protein